MPKQKRYELKQRLERAQEHLMRGMVLVGEVREEVKAAHPESPPPLQEAVQYLVLAFGVIDKYRENI
jgi:hypothetical protein